MRRAPSQFKAALEFLRGLASMARGAAWLLALCALPHTMAERYLTLAELKDLVFPTADRFESVKVEVRHAAGRKPPRPEIEFIFAFKEGRHIGSIGLDAVIGKHEFIDYAVAITPEGKIGQVEILEYRESHGGEIRGKRWRAQFNGKDAASALKLNSDIYNISGATMSCRHVTDGVKNVLATYHAGARERLAACKLRAQGGAR